MNARQTISGLFETDDEKMVYRLYGVELSPSEAEIVVSAAAIIDGTGILNMPQEFMDAVWDEADKWTRVAFAAVCDEDFIVKRLMKETESVVITVIKTRLKGEAHGVVIS